MSEALPRILCVDDEPQVLEGLRLNLRRRFAVLTAEGGEKGLETLRTESPVWVVISDMRMPGMDGAQFLAKVREAAPDTVRILLTGHADLDAAIAAVNEGQIFRFLTKPCPLPQLMGVLDAACRQYQLVTAERELLEKTLQGSVSALSEVLALARPAAYGRASRIRQRAAALCERLGVTERWPIEMAALLGPLGSVALPEETLEKLYRGDPLDENERQMAARSAQYAEKVLANIPRLEPVREILRLKDRPYAAQDGLAQGEALPLGARVLRLLDDLDVLESQGSTPAQALDIVQGRVGMYDPRLVAAQAQLTQRSRTEYQVRELTLDGLREGMIIASDVRSTRDALIIARGNEVTASLLLRLRNLPRGMVREPIRVMLRTGT